IELLPLTHLISEYSFFYPTNVININWSKYKTILEENLDEARLYTITFPYILNNESINEIIELAE
ncbi:unnamed protein product, partial [marine sediment metagenome]